MGILKRLFEARPDWYTGNFQTGYRSPWTGDHIGRLERHCLRTDRKQMRLNGEWFDFKDGDDADMAWRKDLESSLVEHFDYHFRSEHGRGLSRFS